MDPKKKKNQQQQQEPNSTITSPILGQLNTKSENQKANFQSFIQLGKKKKKKSLTPFLDFKRVNVGKKNKITTLK